MNSMRDEQIPFAESDQPGAFGASRKTTQGSSDSPWPWWQ
jgi:hypothetical protein